ncbi:MAG: EVE domain-containing protein [Anaerolineales bacterium]|nr:EVE domain-containing protein [Anaerolineales bacterium]
MAYYLDIFSPETYEAYSKSKKDVTGFRIRQHKKAQQIHPGDKFVCYMTKLSHWVGILEVVSECFVDETPRFYSDDDPFIVRFKVKPNVWLDKEKTIPIKEDHVWNKLSFTKDHEQSGSTWTGKLRGSLTQIDDEDGEFLEEILISQMDGGEIFAVDEREYSKYITQRVRRENRVVTVSVPDDSDEEVVEEKGTIRESARMQALLAQVGESMGFGIWIPKADRNYVLQEWEPNSGSLIEQLPLNYDLVTIRTIEQIDVLWLNKRSIVRAFEVEHTTAVYSGLLRMADLLALQPNMDIKLHIVAPYSRREKVFQELQRPVFSLLDKGPLSELCTYVSYDSLIDLSELEHLNHLSDSVLEDYEEVAE